MNADTLRYTARFLQERAREIAVTARGNPLIEDEPVRLAVQGLYDLSKRLMDARAAEIAANSRLEPGPSHGQRTNVGDPTPHGQGGEAKKR